MHKTKRIAIHNVQNFSEHEYLRSHAMQTKLEMIFPVAKQFTH